MVCKPNARPVRIVIKLSGSILGFNMKPEDLRPYYTVFADQMKMGIQPIIVTGGGDIARHYISLSRSLGADESSLDEMGIEASRLNARLFISALRELCYPMVPKNLDEIAVAVDMGRIVVAGGLHPGHSTNATAALIAERVRAKIFINATDVNGVYTVDPHHNKTAKMFKTIGVGKFTRLLDEGKVKMMAGTYDLMDLVALKVIERSGIPTRIIKCSIKEIQKAAEGKAVGTLVASGDGR